MTHEMGSADPFNQSSCRLRGADEMNLVRKSDLKLNEILRNAA